MTASLTVKFLIRSVAGLLCRQDVRGRHGTTLASLVFNEASPLKMVGLDHERRVCRVDHLTSLRKPLFNESEEVTLRRRVEPQPGLI